MRLREAGTAVVIIFVVALAIIGATSRWFTDGPDGDVEEACEAVIEDITGVDVDLSPLSPETKEETQRGN